LNGLDAIIVDNAFLSVVDVDPSQNFGCLLFDDPFSIVVKVFQSDERFAGMIRSLHEASATMALAAIPQKQIIANIHREKSGSNTSVGKLGVFFYPPPLVKGRARSSTIPSWGLNLIFTALACTSHDASTDTVMAILSPREKYKTSQKD
jgi:hypothetical protein